eukprot:gene12345-14477_t
MSDGDLRMMRYAVSSDPKLVFHCGQRYQDITSVEWMLQRGNQELLDDPDIYGRLALSRYASYFKLVVDALDCAIEGGNMDMCQRLVRRGMAPSVDGLEAAFIMSGSQEIIDYFCSDKRYPDQMKQLREIYPAMILEALIKNNTISSDIKKEPDALSNYRSCENGLEYLLIYANLDTVKKIVTYEEYKYGFGMIDSLERVIRHAYDCVTVTQAMISAIEVLYNFQERDKSYGPFRSQEEEKEDPRSFLEKIASRLGFTLRLRSPKPLPTLTEATTIKDIHKYLDSYSVDRLHYRLPSDDYLPIVAHMLEKGMSMDIDDQVSTLGFILLAAAADGLEKVAALLWASDKLTIGDRSLPIIEAAILNRHWNIARMLGQSGAVIKPMISKQIGMTGDIDQFNHVVRLGAPDGFEKEVIKYAVQFGRASLFDYLLMIYPVQHFPNHLSISVQYGSMTIADRYLRDHSRTTAKDVQKVLDAAKEYDHFNQLMLLPSFNAMMNNKSYFCDLGLFEQLFTQYKEAFKPEPDILEYAIQGGNMDICKMVLELTDMLPTVYSLETALIMSGSQDVIDYFCNGSRYPVQMMQLRDRIDPRALQCLLANPLANDLLKKEPDILSTYRRMEQPFGLEYLMVYVTVDIVKVFMKVYPWEFANLGTLERVVRHMNECQVITDTMVSIIDYIYHFLNLIQSHGPFKRDSSSSDPRGFVEEFGPRLGMSLTPKRRGTSEPAPIVSEATTDHDIRRYVQKFQIDRHHYRLPTDDYLPIVKFMIENHMVDKIRSQVSSIGFILLAAAADGLESIVSYLYNSTLTFGNRNLPIIDAALLNRHWTIARLLHERGAVIKPMISKHVGQIGDIDIFNEARRLGAPKGFEKEVMMYAVEYGRVNLFQYLYIFKMQVIQQQ